MYSYTQIYRKCNTLQNTLSISLTFNDETMLTLKTMLKIFHFDEIFFGE